MSNQLITKNNSEINKTRSSSRKLRVLFVSHAYVVGVNQGKLKAIVDTGQVEVALLAPSNWQALEWNRTIELENPYPEIKIYPAPVLFSGRVGAHIYNPWKIRQVIQDFEPDVIQVEEEIFSLCALEVAFWARIFKKPVVVFGWENQLRSLSAFRRWVRDFVMNSTDLYLAGNQDGAEVMQTWNFPGQLEIMPQMGVDTNLFTPDQREQQDKFTIGFLGRIAPEKGLDILFTAASHLKQQDLDFQVTLCGSGESEKDLRQQAEQQLISDYVFWRGAVKHEAAPVELGKFDVLVLPSRSIATWKEQFGHVIIEAMAMGIPVIGSSCGEIPNVIGCQDLVFPEGNPVALAEILKRAIVDRNWYEEMGNYGKERVDQFYSHERIAQRLIAWWQKLTLVLK
ncbi:MAG: glycosyltransferase [Cyanobacteria bacterium P01_A01_bin.83]